MVGYLHYTGRRGHVRLYRHRIQGLTVLEAALPGKEGRFLAKRRAQKGLKLLRQTGCKRLLAPCTEENTFPLVHTRALWQSMAGPLALTELDLQGLEPRRCVVALHSDRPSRSFLRACQLLAREVKALSLSLESSEQMMWQLQQQLGIPLVEGSGDVTLSFLPGVCRKKYFALGNLDPIIPDYRLSLDGLELPEGCPELPLLAALLDAGRLPLASVEIIPLKDGKNRPQPELEPICSDK